MYTLNYKECLKISAGLKEELPEVSGNNAKSNTTDTDTKAKAFTETEKVEFQAIMPPPLQSHEMTHILQVGVIGKFPSE